MKFGLYLPNSGPLSAPRRLARLASQAETAGWDGLFLWDQVASVHPVDVADPWVALAAIAMATTRIRLGALVTPLPRRRPHKFARETVSLDQLSLGRLTVGVGLGALPLELSQFGDAFTLQERAKRLDEALEVVARCWNNTLSGFVGTYYQAPAHVHFSPGPVQTPRIPVWVAATWPFAGPIRRAATWDGIFPLPSGRPWTSSLTPVEVVAIRDAVRKYRRSDDPYDVVVLGSSDRSQRSAQAVERYSTSGATWWLEDLAPDRWGSWEFWPSDQVVERIVAGPPR